MPQPDYGPDAYALALGRLHLNAALSIVERDALAPHLARAIERAIQRQLAAIDTAVHDQRDAEREGPF